MFSQSKIEEGYTHWKIIIEGIPNNMSQNDIILYFNNYTRVVECTFMIDQSHKGIKRSFGFLVGVHEEARQEILQVQTHYINGESIQCKAAIDNNMIVNFRDVIYQSEENKILIMHKVPLISTIMDINDLISNYGKINQILFEKDKDLNCVYILFKNKNTVDKIIHRNKPFCSFGIYVGCESKVIKGTLVDLFKLLFDKEINQKSNISSSINVLPLQEIKEEENNQNDNTTNNISISGNAPKKKKMFISEIFEPSVLSLQSRQWRNQKLDYQYLRKQLEQLTNENDDKSNISLLKIVDSLKDDLMNTANNKSNDVNNRNSNAKIYSYFLDSNTSFLDTVSDINSIANENVNKFNRNYYNLNSTNMNNIEENSSITTEISLESNNIHHSSHHHNHMSNYSKHILHTNDRQYPTLNNYFKYKLFDSYGENIQKVSIVTSESIDNNNHNLIQINNTHLMHPYHTTQIPYYQEQTQEQLQPNYIINFPYGNINNIPFDAYQREKYYLYQTQMFKPKKRLMKTYCPY